MLSKSDPIKIQVEFPETKKKVELEVELDAPIKDLIETLVEYFTLPETETIILYKKAERDPKMVISDSQTGAMMGWKEEDTVYAYINPRIKLIFDYRDMSKKVNLEVEKDMKLSDLRETISFHFDIGPNDHFIFENAKTETVIPDETKAGSFEPNETIRIKTSAVGGTA